jgi:hypothetical protein
MEHFAISKTEAGLHIEGFDDAVKVVEIGGQKAKRLADLSLHKTDLEFAETCLDAINQVPEEPIIFQEALWRSAVVHFLKCFGKSTRFKLDPKKLYKKDPPTALIAFNYFNSLRNKHLVHDENSYAQGIPGAILNDGGKSYKIEKIVCITVFGATLTQENYTNLKLLTQKARAWVTSEFDSLCEKIAAELEMESYESLLAKNSLTYIVPTVGEIHHARNKS